MTEIFDFKRNLLTKETFSINILQNTGKLISFNTNVYIFHVHSFLKFFENLGTISDFVT